VLEQRTNLGAAVIPSTVPVPLRDQLAAALDLAFVDGYRVVIYATTLLALLAALAGALIPKRVDERRAMDV